MSWKTSLSVVPEWCLLFGFDRPEVAFRVPRESATVGVGVGSSVTAVRKSKPPEPCAPAPFVSEVRGVGSNDEHPLAAVRGADVGSS